MQPDLPASTNTKKTGLTANGNGVLTIAPKNSSESGGNATLGKFVSGYKGLELSSSSLQYPGKPLYNNGDVCPKGTPDSGKPGVVIVDSWTNFESKGKGTETSGRPAGSPVRQRPAHHHGLRAGHRLDPQAPGVGHHQPDHLAVPGHRPRPPPLRPPPPRHRPATTTAHHGADHFDDSAELRRKQQVRAVVLVGGEGTRLRPLTLTAPKQMLPIVEQPMIERVIGHLADHGIEEAVLSLGYRPDAFMNAYPGDSSPGSAWSYAVEPTPLDTAGAIRFAARHSCGSTRPSWWSTGTC